MVTKKDGFMYVLDRTENQITVEKIEIYIFSADDGNKALMLNCDCGGRGHDFVYDPCNDEWDTFGMTRFDCRIWCYERNDEKARKIFADEIHSMIKLYESTIEECREQIETRTSNYDILMHMPIKACGKGENT